MNTNSFGIHEVIFGPVSSQAPPHLHAILNGVSEAGGEFVTLVARALPNPSSSVCLQGQGLWFFFASLKQFG